MSELGDVLWTPSAERIAASHLARFAAQSGFAASDYAGLHAWSVRDAEAFYNKLWTFVGIIGEKGSRVMQPAAALPDVRFFPDAHLSYAENVLRDPDQRLALIAHREDGTRRQLTRRELADLVSRMAQALRAEGVAPGDRVAAIVTNDIEAIALTRYRRRWCHLGGMLAGFRPAGPVTGWFRLHRCCCLPCRITVMQPSDRDRRQHRSCGGGAVDAASFCLPPPLPAPLWQSGNDARRLAVAICAGADRLSPGGFGDPLAILSRRARRANPNALYTRQEVCCCSI